MIKVSRIEKHYAGNNDFLENIEYTETIPYFLLEKEISRHEIVPLHYGPTIEILLLSGVTGSIVFGQNSLSVQENCVALIPPDIIHSTNLTGIHGHKCVLELSLQQISRYFNISSILNLYRLSLFQLNPIYTEEYEAMRTFMHQLVAHDGEFITCFRIILDMLRLMIDRTLTDNMGISVDLTQNAAFQRLITWTHENLSRKITLEDAASVAGFSKTYFCTYFKQITGMSYVSYLQRLRIYQAQYYLSQGISIADCCYACGYDNLSYFMKIFKEFTGETMLAFQKNGIKEN